MSGLFDHKYPYENFHELNLDWILSEIKRFAATLESWQQTIDEILAAIEQFDDLEARTLKLERATADLPTIRANIATLQANVLALSNQDLILQKQIDKIKNNWNNIQTQIDDVYNYINAKINTVNVRITSEIYAVKVDYNTKFHQILRWMDEIDYRINHIDTSVINPWHPELGRITQDENARLIHNDLADECLTAEQYSRLGLTAADYATYDLTAINYAQFGKTRLHFNWVYMPVEGIKQDISNVLTSIINNIMGTLTAAEYAALNLDADDYAALDLTSQQYQAYNTNGVGLTAEQYAALNMLNSGLVHV